ncbi:AMP-binding protein [Streptomyces sp. NBC_00378]|uniref:AMP-binding protein n=1 Tax=unclassified Streptomyces TaxID=2593676 RepID=UPI00338ECBCE
MGAEPVPDGRTALEEAATPAAGLVEAIAHQVRDRPGAVAVCRGEDRSAYRGLDARAGRISLRLRELGARGGAPVAILMERSLDMAAAMPGTASRIS